MKPTKIVLLLALCGMSSFALAQDLFKVLASKGNNEVKSGDSWQPLKIGASLRQGEELKLVDNAYVALVFTGSGMPRELKQAGTYKVDVLASEMAGGGSSVISKYTDFILSSNSPDAKKNRLSATGAVHRNLEGDAITVMLPEEYSEAGVYNKNAVIHWESSSTVAGPFVVTFKNTFDEVLKTMETPENMLTVDISDPAFTKWNPVFVTVSSKSDPKLASKQYLLKQLSTAEHEKIQADLSELMGVVGEQTALNNLILAGFYEDHGLLIDALAAYDSVVRLAPDVPTYKDAREEFLLRQGLKK